MTAAASEDSEPAPARARVVVFGSINLDLIGALDRLPAPGETVHGNRFHTAPGGKGANQALAAARAGGEVRMIGAVGLDAFATEALHLLRESGLDLAAVRMVNHPTGVALILVQGDGENVIVVISGANNAVEGSDAAALEFQAGDVLVMQLEIPTPAIAAAAYRAKQARAHVLLNFAPFRAEALTLLPNVTHLVVNENECAAIAAASGLQAGEPADQAAALSRRFELATIVTLGRDGVVAVVDGRVERASALPVRAIDAVGAGDTFCGYFAAALAEGLPLSTALALAAAAGSLACTRPGAQPAIPLREEVEAALAAQKPRLERPD